VLGDWISDRPGTRPRGWWAFDAPEQRRRLGGVGEPICEFAGWFDFGPSGLPEGAEWPADAALVHYYGRGRVIDPLDPPLYEAQATFLKRHGLLTAAEERRLCAADFAPEALRARPPRRQIPPARS
jgi:hypothetical protein